MSEGRVRNGLHGGEIFLVYLIRGDSIICGGVAGISLGVLRSVVRDQSELRNIPCLGGSRRSSGSRCRGEDSVQLILKHLL
jgi:hypothetical protein